MLRIPPRWRTFSTSGGVSILEQTACLSASSVRRIIPLTGCHVKAANAPLTRLTALTVHPIRGDSRQAKKAEYCLRRFNPNPAPPSRNQCTDFLDFAEYCYFMVMAYLIRLELAEIARPTLAEFSRPQHIAV